MKEKKISLSVVIPAYNEEKRLGQTITEVNKYLKSRQIKGEIIVVDDGSKDKTAAIAKSFLKKIPKLSVISYQPNRGKGKAVKEGMLRAKGKFVAFIDTDLSTPLKEFDKLLPEFKNGYDIVIGSRAVKDAKVVRHQKWYRELLGKTFGLLDRALLFYGVKDTQCGFKVFKCGVVQKIFPQVTSRSEIFDMEVLMLASRSGYQIKEVGVEWTHNPDTRIPYNLQRALAIFKELLRIKFYHRIFWPVKAKK